MAERVGEAQLDDLTGKQPKRPMIVAVGGLRARDGGDLGGLLGVELGGLAWAGELAQGGLQAALGKPLVRLLDGRQADVQAPADVESSNPPGELFDYSCARDDARLVGSIVDDLEDEIGLVLREGDGGKLAEGHEIARKGLDFNLSKSSLQIKVTVY